MSIGWKSGGELKANSSKATESVFEHISTPSNPEVGFLKFYAKSDNNLYKLTSAGVETAVGGGGGVSYPLLAPIGSLAAPSYSFSADPNTGIYSDGTADYLGFVSGGAKAFFMTAVGGVSKLRTDTSGAPPQLDFVPTSAGYDAALIMSYADFTQNGGLFYLGARRFSGVINAYPWKTTFTGGIAMAYEDGDVVPAIADGTIKVETGTPLTLDADSIQISNDGTVTAPVVSWPSDTDTGFYRVSSGVVGLALNGSTVSAGINRHIRFVDLNVAFPGFGTGIIQDAPGSYYASGLEGTTPGSPIHVWMPTSAGITLESGGTSGASTFAFVRSRGTTPTARVSVLTNDNLGRMEFQGYTTSAIKRAGARMQVLATETWSETNRGADWRLETNLTGAATTTEAIRHDGVGTTLFMRASAAHLKWNTDGGGDIGASGANRPASIFLSVGATAPTVTGSTTVTSPSVVGSTSVTSPLVRGADVAAGTALTVRSGNSTSSGNGGQTLTLSGGAPTGISAAGGGGVTILGTAGVGNSGGSQGGSISIQAGAGGGPANNQGGTLDIISGSGAPSGQGGLLQIIAGDGGATAGNGGDIVIKTGTAPSGTAGVLQLQVGNTARMRIQETGNTAFNSSVVIGTSVSATPNYELDIRGGAGNSTIQQTNTASGTTSADGVIYDFDGTHLNISNRQSAGDIRLTTNGGVTSILDTASYAVLHWANAATGTTLADGVIAELDTGGGFNFYNQELGVMNFSTGAQQISLDDSNNAITIASNIVRIGGGDLEISTVGKGLKIAEGANAKAGTATLVAGTVVVSTTAISAGSHVILSRNGGGGVWGNLDADPANYVAGTSFQIDSDNIADTSTVFWMIVDPA